MAASVVLCLLVAAAAAGGIWWVRSVKAPELPTAQNPSDKGPGDGGAEEAGLGSLVEGVDIDEELPDYISDQKDGVYTFLLIGRTTMDDNSDMLMLVVFDSNTGEVNACSIPRDTMINVSSGARKINLAIWSGVDYTKNWVRKALGVYPNFYVMVDWNAIGEMVDAIGGVYFDVPCRMYYVDPTAGFTIDLEPGYQLLDGEKAMQLIRWRKNASGYTQYAAEAGFDGSDTKRTEMQQAFIVAAAKQILQVKNLPYLGSMIQAFNENVETDLTAGNLAWFAQKALSLGSADKVTFHTLPANYNGSAYCANTKNDQSYVTFQPGALVELVNTCLNPYESRISLGDLDLMGINSDGTIRSSTGSVADTAHNRLIQDVNSGLAYFTRDAKGRTVVAYYETEEDPEPDAEDPETGAEPEGPAPSGTETPPEGGGQSAGEETVGEPATEPSEGAGSPQETPEETPAA